MKKLTALILACIFAFCGLCAAAEGKLTVTDKNVILYSGRDSGIFIARVENTGDSSICYDNGKLVIFSEDDEILATENYVYSSPSRILLKPGEYTYVYEFLWNSALKGSALGDIKFSVSTSNRGNSWVQIPATAELDLTLSSNYNNYINVTFTNETSDVLYDFYIVCAMMDDEDNLVYVDRESYSHIGIHPGSTVTIKDYIDSSLVGYYRENGIKPTKLDVMVFYDPS